MYYTYVLTSINNPTAIYIGYSTDVNKRLLCHNEGMSVYTNKDRLWKLAVSISFPNKSIALAFEKYLKSHSGRAFLRKRLI